jgi:TIR domain/Protein of unknown function (DUF1566)
MPNAVSDIFISYASEDRERVRPLAHALEAEGWLIFWDQTIPPGETWVKYIGKALDEARCVVVIWSQASVESSWVYEEAERGRQRGVLIPVLFDNVSVPLGFASVQTAQLIGWDGGTTSHAFQQFRVGLERRLGLSPVARQHKLEQEQRQPAKEELDRKAEEQKRRRVEQTDWENRRQETRARLLYRSILLGFVLFALAGIVGVLVVRYAWEWPKAFTKRREVPGVSKHEPPKNQSEESQSTTPKAEPGRSPVYLDSTTGLLWTKSDNGHNVTWSQANGYCQNLRLGGYSDWRLPTLEELEKLYDPKAGDGSQIRGPFKLTGWHVWSSTKRDSYSVWGFGFAFGGRLVSVLNASDNMRALCVRGPGE